MYSKTFQHPIFPMREFTITWEKRYEEIRVFYQGNLILEFEDTKALKEKPIVEIDGIGKLEVAFLPKPFRFEISVNGIESPRNDNYPAKKIRRRAQILFIPLVCYAAMAYISYHESKGLAESSRIFDEQIAMLGLGMFVFSLVTYATLLGRIVLVYMVYYWFHVITGSLLFLYFLSQFQGHFGGNWQYEGFIFTVICFAFYFTGLFWPMRMLYLPCKKLFKINRMIAVSEGLLD
ncbi:MAG TPA: hypothetical protein VK151_10715 [Fluviicola sp.]|nr:hypothetical protein [Fluviicola sp.]